MHTAGRIADRVLSPRSPSACPCRQPSHCVTRISGGMCLGKSNAQLIALCSPYILYASPCRHVRAAEEDTGLWVMLLVPGVSLNQAQPGPPKLLCLTCRAPIRGLLFASLSAAACMACGEERPYWSRRCKDADRLAALWLCSTSAVPAHAS